MKGLFKYSFLLLLLVSISSCSDDDDVDDVPTKEISMTDQILSLVNTHRKTKGLNTLKRNTTADKLANEHCDYMISKNKISHDNFSSRTKKLRNNENAKSIGENVAYGYNTAQKVVDGWLNSSGHKENIEGDFTHTGIAAVKNPDGTYYFTQLFYR